MDVDAIGKHVSGLLAFKKRVEAIIDAAEGGETTAAEALSGRIDELSRKVGDLDVRVTSKLEQVLGDIEEKLAGVALMLTWFEENRAALDVVLSMGDDLATTISDGAAQEEKPAVVTITAQAPEGSAEASVNETVNPPLPEGVSATTEPVAVPDAVSVTTPAPEAETPAI
jgi:hypothetical protein